MKILLSPSKNLNENLSLKGESVPLFLGQSKIIQEKLKSLSPAELASLHEINSKLAELNYRRNQQWSVERLLEKGTPALFTFTGDVYRGLDVNSLSVEALEYLNDKILILSGLYGILRAWDKMLPYRLEMGTKISIDSFPDLYHFWKRPITEFLTSTNDDFILNLASNEYASAIDFSKVEKPVCTATFLDKVKGKYRPVNIFLKRARGLMVRYIALYQISSPEGIMAFDLENYKYNEELSNETTFVFVRDPK